MHRWVHTFICRPTCTCIKLKFQMYTGCLYLWCLKFIINVGLQDAEFIKKECIELINVQNHNGLYVCRHSPNPDCLCYNYHNFLNHVNVYICTYFVHHYPVHGALNLGSRWSEHESNQRNGQCPLKINGNDKSSNGQKWPMMTMYVCILCTPYIHVCINATLHWKHTRCTQWEASKSYTYQLTLTEQLQVAYMCRWMVCTCSIHV